MYQLDRTSKVTHPDTVVLGLGYPTLVPDNGIVAMTVANLNGVDIAGVMFDAGPVNSPVLLKMGTCRDEGDPDGNGDGARRNDGDRDAGNPSALQDVFFRIGRAAPGRATTSLIVNSDNVILDDIWSWRADHGNAVGWTRPIVSRNAIGSSAQEFDAHWLAVRFG